MGVTPDRALALVCYCTCAVAVFALLDLGERAATLEPRWRRRKWLLAALLGAAAGLWTAGLIGIRALAWPAVDGYGLGGAAWSALGALGVAAAALYSTSARTLPQTRLAPALAVMAGSMAALYLGGLASLRLQPPIRFSTLPLAAAMLTAASVSLLALATFASLRRYARGNRFAVHIAAALVLAAAICAVQFAFLHAARAAPGAVESGRPAIPGVWAGAVLGPVAAGLLIILMLLSRMEAQVVAERQARERQRLAAESIRRVTYFDGVTGLPNRSQFSEALIKQLISVNGRMPPPFGVLHAEIRNYAQLLERLGQERLNRVLARLAQQLSATVHPGDLLARLSHDSFVYLLRRREPSEVQAALDAVAAALQVPLQDEGEPIALAWALGSSHYPGGGNSTRMLLRAAMKPQREFLNEAPPAGDSGAALLTGLPC
ncbi:MAG: diguanylate cyclase [Nevskia sp.]|nr:diguanylate cyclase [Nevskia sp.]